MSQNLNEKIVTITEIQKCSTKNQKKYYKLTVSDIQGNYHKAIIWNCLDILPINSVLLIVDSEYNHDFHNYTIKGFTVQKKGSPGLSKEKREHILEILKEECITNKNQSNETKIMLDCVLNYLNVNEEYILFSSAAMVNHHAYVGGLLQHTYELVRFIIKNRYIIDQCDSFALCIAGAIMHDMGKIFEYDTDQESGIATYRNEFPESLGLDRNDSIGAHSLYGYNWAMNNGFFKLAHILGSHHNYIDHGALFTPKTKEAQLVYSADYFSSRFGKIHVGDL